MSIEQFVERERLTSARLNELVDAVNAVEDAVSGPESSTDNAVVRFDGTTGKIVQNSRTTLTEVVYDEGTMDEYWEGTIDGPDRLFLGTPSGVSVPNGLIVSEFASLPADVTVDDVQLYMPQTAKVATAQTTTSTSYTDLATVGPSVSLTLASAGVVKVVFGAQSRYTAGTGQQNMALAVSGATTSAAGSTVLQSSAVAGGTQISSSSSTLVFRTHTVYVYCNAGTNTFTCKYAASSSTTSEFSNRFIQVQQVT